MKHCTILLMLLVAFGASAQKFDLAKTPPMGWNSWNTFACNIDEKLIRETAEHMVSSGMRDAGYVYVNIDDCWHGERDSLGFIQPDPVRFPSGMKALADYVHSLGLKLGIYSDAGTKTCAGYPGSRGYEYQDALTYARWGIDYLKYDWCNTDSLNPAEAYKTMRDAIYAAGRPMVLSICEWGDNEPWRWGKEIGHLWRTTGDIHLCWDCELGFGTWSKWGVLNILDKQEGLRKYAGPGHWNDPDMLQVGNGLTAAQDRAHFSLWAMLAAPLMAGNDIRSMSDQTREILTNREVIAINQDELGIQCYRMLSEGQLQVFVKPLANNEVAILFLNRGDTALNLDFDWKKFTVNDGMTGRYHDFNQQTFKLRDLWEKAEAGTTAAPLKKMLPAHDVLMLRLTAM
ncbi:MAG: glycoside hydrolase family 27 protein [Bacteroidales bacterium]|nr:glycoside hydrolase family 27 protein [Bacteroidales bacterium]